MVHYCGCLPLFSTVSEDSEDSFRACECVVGVNAVNDSLEVLDQRSSSSNAAICKRDNAAPLMSCPNADVRLLRTPIAVNAWASNRGTQSLPAQPPGTLRFVVISDTHSKHDRLHLPPGDVLLHCGDCFQGIAPFRRDTRALKEFFAWLNEQPFAVKIFIGGNHDAILSKRDAERVRAMAAPSLYLCDDSVVLEPVGLRIYGSPRSVPNSFISPNTAFQSHTLPWDASPKFSLPGNSAVPSVQHSEIERHGWIPGTTATTHSDPSTASAVKVTLTARMESMCEGPVDILLTHQGLEPTRRKREGKEKKESKHNAAILEYISVVQPRRLHCGGHAHGGHGMYWVASNGGSGRMKVVEPYVSGVSPTCERNGGEKRRNEKGSHATNRVFDNPPFILSVNAAVMLKNSLFGCTLQPPLVVDIAV